MQALATSALQLGQAQPETVMQDSLPNPSAPPMAGASGTGPSSYPPVWQPYEGEAHVCKSLCCWSHAEGRRVFEQNHKSCVEHAARGDYVQDAAPI